MSFKTGNKNASDEGKLPPECYQVDALDYDCYPEDDEKVSYETSDQKLQVLKQFDNKGYCSWKLEEVYPSTEVTTEEKLRQQIEQFEEWKKQKKHFECCESKNPSNDIKKQEERNKD